MKVDPKDRWVKTWLEARIWWCEDDVCDCTQPQIDELSPNINAGYPWIHRKKVWEGTFNSEATGEESETQKQELKAKANELGIPLDDNFYGLKEAQTPPPKNR